MYMFLLGAYPGVELLDHRASVHATLVDTEDSFSKVNYLHSHLPWMRRPLAAPPHQHLLFSVFFPF